MTFPKQVRLVEVGPRDGLQNETQAITTDLKLKLIDLLGESGLTTIEVTSFVSAQKIAQMADHLELFQNLKLKNGVNYPVLIPNIQGLERAIAANVRDIAIFGAPSEPFLQKNINCSIAENWQRFAEIISRAKRNNMRIRGYISCVLGCPYLGNIDPTIVRDYAAQLWQMGVDEISLGDTIGVGTPQHAQQLINTVTEVVPREHIAVHFHDSYGQALANIYACLELGVSIIDCSVAGLGGCPYAPGSSGNVATEDIIYLLNGLQIQHGVDLNRLVEVSRFIQNKMTLPIRSKAALALLGKSQGETRTHC